MNMRIWTIDKTTNTIMLPVWVCDCRQLCFYILMCEYRCMFECMYVGIRICMCESWVRLRVTVIADPLVRPRPDSNLCPLWTRSDSDSKINLRDDL